MSDNSNLWGEDFDFLDLNNDGIDDVAYTDVDLDGDGILDSRVEVTDSDYDGYVDDITYL